MPTQTPYETLGVARDASAEAIRTAYRKLAKIHHPDLNPNNAAAEAKFKTIASAHALLSDPDKRARFDRGEIDAEGHEAPPQPRYRDHAQTNAGQRYSNTQSTWGPDDLESMFGTMFTDSGFGPRPTGAHQTGPTRGADAHYTLTTSFLDAVNGATTRLTLPDGRTLDVKIPPATENGHILRLRGKGSAIPNGPAGDALITIHLTPHPFFTRDGQTIRLDLPVTLAEAVLGGPVEIPTPGGPVRMRIPPQSDTGTTLRLRGRGVPAHGNLPAGDLYATLRPTIGPPDAALESFLRDWKPATTANPRQNMETTP